MLRKPRTLQVRLDGDAFDALEELAVVAELSVSDYVRGLVARHLRAKGRTPPPPPHTGVARSR